MPFYDENGAGVLHINGLSGDVVLAAGTNITLVTVGNTITINASGGGGGTIGGNIAQNQIAYGSPTPNSIQGDANLTWDGTNFTANSGEFAINDPSGNSWFDFNFGNNSVGLGDLGLVNNGTQFLINDNAEEIVGMTANHFDIRDISSNNILHIDTTGGGSQSFYNGALFGFNTQNPSQAVDVKGNVNIGGSDYYMVNNQNFATEDSQSNIKIGVGTGANLAGATNTVMIGDGAGGSVTTNGSNISIGVNSDAGNSFNTIAIGDGAVGAGFQGIAIGGGATLTADNQFVAGNQNLEIRDVYFGRGVSDISATDWTLHGTDGSGTNNAGGGLNIQGGRGTGNTSGGPVQILVSPAGSSGSSYNLPISVASFSSSAVTLADPYNFVLGTTTGTKIGTSTSQKIGFFNTVPVIQPTGMTVAQSGANLGLWTSLNPVAVSEGGTGSTTLLGAGIGQIVGNQRSTGRSGATSLTAYTVGASDETLQVSANINVTASTVNSFTTTCTYTDETNTSRTLTLTFSNISGTFLTTITNALGVGAYEGIPLHIRAKSGTTVTIATTGTFTTVTYNFEERIIKY